jgi:4-amino-4-deoxy-L-arabinose transferase-like glycosyltransferase
VLALAAILLCHHLTEPYTGLHEWQSASMSAAARNHLRYGYAATRLGVIENDDVVPPEWFRYYTDHPPLVPVLVSLSFRVFGEHEWSARLVPIVLTLGSTVLIYLLGTALGGRRLGLLSAFIYALLPMNAYFGRMVSHEAPTSFFALAMALAYLQWHRTRRPVLFGIALSAFLLGALCGWPAYYLAGILPLHHVLAAGRRREWKVLAFPLTAILLFGLHLADVYWLQGPTGLSYLASMFLFRTKLHLSPALEALGIRPAAVTFTSGEFLVKELEQADALFTPLVLVLAALALYDMIRRRGGEGSSDPLFMVALLLFGMTHVALFPQAAWQHEYMLFYCSAPLALLAGIGALSLAREASQARVLGVLAVLFMLAALSRTRSLYRLHNSDIYRLAPLVKQYTRPGEEVVTNATAIYGEAPQIGYYAGRDVSYNPVFQAAHLERRLAAARQRPFAFILSEEEQGQAELGPWLTSRYSSQRADFLGKWYVVFHIPQARDST